MTKLLMAATAAFVLSITFNATVQAGVIGPHSAVENASQSINMIDKTRRICRSVMVCNRFPCRMVQQCYVTADYPPENHSRR